MKTKFSTVTQIKGLKPRGAWYDVYDAKQRGLAVRVSPKGEKVFTYIGRIGGAPTRRKIGYFGEGRGKTSLEGARTVAAKWRTAIDEGRDPKQEKVDQLERQKRDRQEQEGKRASSFEIVAERYIAEHLADKRRGKDDAREIRRLIIPAWRGRPVSEITPQDVKALIKPLGKKTPALAHLTLNHVKRIYSWILNDDTDYGITASPSALLKPEKLVGKRKIRTRVLNDNELWAYWRATGRLGYPAGSMYRLIALTGVRISEASDAQWPEFNFLERLWTIPSERFKSEQAHVVPLGDESLKVLGQTLNFAGGDFVFTTTGKKPVGGLGKPKSRLEVRMLRALRALARKRGDDPAKVVLEPFVIHDIRRTVRTRLSEIDVDDKIAELVIGHGKRGLARVYDHAKHLPKMYEALQKWADHLMEIVGEAAPRPANVVEFPKRA